MDIKKILLLLAGSTALAVPGFAASFNCLLDGYQGDCGSVASQFNVQAFDMGGGVVGFQFSHTGSVAVVVNNIHFSDTADVFTGFYGNSWIAPGVNFFRGGAQIAPGTPLPSGFVEEFQAQALVGQQLGPGEQITILMQLAQGMAAADLEAARASGAFGIILRTIGIGGPNRTVYMAASGSDYGAGQGTPEPASYLLMGLGLTAVGLYRRRS